MLRVGKGSNMKLKVECKQDKYPILYKFLRDLIWPAWPIWLIILILFIYGVLA